LRGGGRSGRETKKTQKTGPIPRTRTEKTREAQSKKNSVHKKTQRRASVKGWSGESGQESRRLEFLGRFPANGKRSQRTKQKKKKSTEKCRRREQSQLFLVEKIRKGTEPYTNIWMGGRAQVKQKGKLDQGRVDR